MKQDYLENLKKCKNATRRKPNKQYSILYGGELKNETSLQKGNPVSLKSAKIKVLWKNNNNIDKAIN